MNQENTHIVYPRRVASLFCLMVSFISLLTSQEPRVLNSAEIKLALKRLTVLGSSLFVAAHPDDENTAFLATMTQGRLYRAAYLAMTRGEGGQNLIGPEQGDLMGVIRTQELLAARNIDGAEQYFTRAIDFGFSKTMEETVKFWGKEKTLSDVVWVIRSFRPDVIVNRFTPQQGGHGNHSASAAFATEAFEAAADPNRFPEQLRYVQPWKAKRIVWNVFRFQQSDNPTPPPNSVSLDLGGYNTLLGKSYTEISGESRSMHKSQGFGAGQNRGEFINYFQHVAGEPAQNDLFDGVNTEWSRVEGGKEVDDLLAEAQRSFHPEDPSKVIPVLLKAYDAMNRLSDPWADIKKSELESVIKSCAGIWIDAISAENSAVSGAELKLTTVVINRSHYPFVLERVSAQYGERDTVLNARLAYNVPNRSTFSVKLPAVLSYSQPYWLVQEGEAGSYVVTDEKLVGYPENVPSLSAKIVLSSSDGKLSVSMPVRFRSVDPVEGELYRPFVVVPPVAVNLPEAVHVFPELREKKVEVNLRSGTTNVRGSVRLKVPNGWLVKPETIPFEFKGKNEEQYVSFTVKPSNGAVSGGFLAEADVAGKKVTQGTRTIQYKHIPPQTVFPVAEGKLLRFDVKRRGQNIGYIMGAGDEIPVALRQVGYSVSLLSDEEIAEGDFSKYDAIVAGVRAYNTRPKLRTHQKRLMEYVEKGGTYVVQYVTLQRGESENIGPYPLTISRDRVTVEDSEVTLLNPKSPFLSLPHKVNDDDFKGWIQERGLYFASKWDAKYDSLLSMNDPGESPKRGSLLVSTYGKGIYVYTGLAFFRQLPAGVPGAYRLFVNLVSARNIARRDGVSK
ncbi:MAG: PIG-L family deacetylase [Ignavibacteriales bacterium]|nr:PIG-L family deacetylase [Ignavibacteriales bacterium]